MTILDKILITSTGVLVVLFTINLVLSYLV